MSEKSGIQWTDATWNPIVGCQKISPGCENCYAEKWAARLAKMGQEDYRSVIDSHTDEWNGNLCYRANYLIAPIAWKQVKRIFVCSMGDFFHKGIGNRLRDEIMRVMWMCRDRHTFILCTKRPEEMRKYFLQYNAPDCDAWPWPHVWLMTTIENQELAEKRIPILIDTPAIVHGISVEPMLGAIDIMQYAPFLEWVICGCESGKDRRHCENYWIRFLCDQCKEAMIPFFLKQMDIDGKVIKMPELDGHTWAMHPKQREVEAFNHI